MAAADPPPVPAGGPAAAAGERAAVTAALLGDLLSRIPIAVVAMAADGSCTLSAGRLLTRLGLAEHEIEGQNLPQLCADQPDVVGALTRALGGEHPRCTWTSPTGLSIDVWLEPVTGADGLVHRVLGIGLDRSDRLRADHAEQALRVSERSLLHQLARVQDAERRRIAADLHDDTVQVLAAAGLRLTLAQRQVQAQLPDVAAGLAELGEQVTGAALRLSRIVPDVEPPALTRLGFAVAVHELVTQSFTGVATTATLTLAAAGAAGVDADGVDADGVDADGVDADGVDAGEEPVGLVARTLYEIAVQALADVRLHADATHVLVDLTRTDDWWSLRVEDDGPGLPPGAERAHHLALAAMRGRALAAGGTVTTGPRAGGGTAVLARVPTYTGTGVAPVAPHGDASLALSGALSGHADQRDALRAGVDALVTAPGVRGVRLVRGPDRFEVGDLRPDDVAAPVRALGQVVGSLVIGWDAQPPDADVVTARLAGVIAARLTG